MAGVRINTGPVSYFSKPVDVPPEKWRDLMWAKRDFMKTKIKYDCSCLIEFVEQAQDMWNSIGFDSVEDMIRNGYELDPSEIDLAITWLKIKDPNSKVGLKEAAEKGRVLAARAKGVPVLNEPGGDGSNQYSKPDKNENIREAKEYGTSAQYRIAKLKRDHPEVAERMEQGEFKTVAEAERAAGIGRPIKTRLERFIASFERLDDIERKKFFDWLGSRQ